LSFDSAVNSVFPVIDYVPAIFLDDMIAAGQISSSSDEDWYRYNAASSGQLEAIFEVPSTGSEHKAWIVSVFDSEGVTLSSYWVSSTQHVIAGLPSSGTYYLGVKSANGFLGTPNDNYTITSYFDPGSFEIEFEPNNHSASADKLTSIISGQIYEGDEDWYRYDATSAGQLEVIFEVPTVSFKAWLVSVFDSEGVTLSSYSVSSTQNILASLPSSGTYYLGVKSAGGYLGNPDDNYTITSYFDQEALNNISPVVIVNPNIAMYEVNQIATTNNNFTNGTATIIFDNEGNISNYVSSLDHSDVGTIVVTVTDLDASEISIMEGVYTEISTLESVVNSIQSSASIKDVAKVSLEFTGFSSLTDIVVNWDDDTSTVTITFNGLFEGEERTNSIFTMTTGSDGELTAFNYTADSPSGAKQLELAHLNETHLYGSKVFMKAISDLYDLEQAANHTSKLTNSISFDLYKEGNDTSQDLIIDNGELRINENYSFDTIKITDTNNYTQNINISDAIDVLRHIVDLESLTTGSIGYHAADVNNDGQVNISDAIDILRHIVDLESIDTFDLIDETGNRINDIDASALGNAPEWRMIANGDVNLSGEFNDAYVMADIV